MEQFKDKFYLNFIADDRWMYLLTGLKTTFIITIFALIIGLIIGFIVAIIRASADKTGKFKIANAICKIYLAIVRGTPIMIQLLIMYYIIFVSPDVSKTFVAIIAFGVNSGAYVAEIMRSGIMSIDTGQTEAGRSLGLSHFETMRYIGLCK